MDILVMLGRVVLALFFINFGVSHFTKLDAMTGWAEARGLKAAKPLIIISGIALVLGGLSILLGVFVTWALIGLAIFLALAAFLMHHFWTDSEPEKKMTQMVHFLSNLALAGALLMLLALPQPWLWSLL